MKTIPLEQGSQEWLSYRRTKVMASDSAIILGHSDYTTPFQLWERKLGLIPEQEETEPMRRGKRLEPIAREMFCKETGIDMVPCVGESETHEWLAASFDGYSEKDESILEIKCNGKKNHDIALGGDVPLSHWIQMQHQMYVAGVLMGYYYSFDGNGGITIKVEFSNEYFVKSIPQLYQFWRGVILFDPPALTDRDYKDMSTCKKWEELTERYINLDAEIKKKEVEKDSLRRNMIELCGDFNCKGNGVKLLKTVTKGRINYEGIPELFGVDLEKHRKDSTTSWRVYIE